MNDGQLRKFIYDHRGMCVLEDTSDCHVLNQIDLIRGCTPREVQIVDNLRKLCHDLKSPNYPNLLNLLRPNIARNNHITVEDYKLAESIVGNDVSYVTGKGTRPHQEIFLNEDISPAQTYEK